MSMIGRYKNAPLAALGLALGLAGFSGAAEAYTFSKEAIAVWVQTESGGRTNAVNPVSTATGLNQMTAGTLVARGLAKWREPYTSVGADAFGPNGNLDKYIEYTLPAEFGINNNADYRNSMAAQEYVLSMDVAARGVTMDRLGLSKYMGQTVNGVQMSEAMMLKCMGFGEGNCQKFLTNPNSLNPATMQHMMQGFNSVAKTEGLPNLPTWNTDAAGTAAGEANPSAPSNLPEGLYCDPEVVSMIQTLGAQEYDARVSLATNPKTGYTLMGGRSVLVAAGVPGAVETSDGGPDTFRGASCLDRLFGSGGFSSIFNPPGIDDILNMLSNALCNGVQGLMTSVTSPLNQQLYRNTQVDGFLPGFGLGAVATAVRGGGTGVVNGALNSASQGALNATLGYTGINTAMGKIGLSGSSVFGGYGTPWGTNQLSHGNGGFSGGLFGGGK